MDTKTSDFYKILGVNKNATMDEIKYSYRKLVLKYHPDKNNSAEAPEKFRKIQIAYETLSNDHKRAKYDTFDNMDNGFAVKDIFMYYHELISEICQKYDLDDNEKEEIIGLFNPDDFRLELENNDINSANKKLTDKIISYIPGFMMKKISKKFPYLGVAINFLSKWLG